MRCPKCRHENSAASKFCSECGLRLAQSCRTCGAELAAGAKFCSQCGGTAGDPTKSSVRFASPESYTPRHLAQKILTSKSALEGERKQVTVLFADLKGSMELLAERDPEEARALLDPVLERMMEAVHHFEGTVNQVMGDGIMALFGAPVAHEDHAVRACYAALRMQAAVATDADRLQQAEGVPIQIRVGLNSGEVVVRSIGSDLNMDYSAVGQTTHLAARMEQMATPGSILLTADTVKLAEGYFEVGPRGPVTPKGMSEPIEIFELTRATPLRRRLDAAQIRGLTPFVGRRAELDQLGIDQAQAAQGRGRTVAVVGEAGVGKSRLFHEFTRSDRRGNWLFMESGAAPYGKATPYLPIVDLLKSYFQIERADEIRVIREKVTERLLALDRALEPALPAVLALLDASNEDAGWNALEPSVRRRRTVDAVIQILLSESRLRPLCLMIEDLHWIDSETQSVLDRLVENLPAARMLLLVNYRPEYSHSWGAKTYYRQLRLDSLTTDGAERLLEVLLGSEPALDRLKSMLIERTLGNPFFLEESVRTLVETGALIGTPGAYRSGVSVDATQVPATVQAVLAARIDRLSPEEKDVLQLASVIGETVPRNLLRVLADLSDDELDDILGRLQRLEFLYQTALFPDAEYTFRHALTCQVAYEGLLHERRRLLHARIVDVIEELFADRLNEHSERLAFHAVRGANWEKAYVYLHQAGARAVARSASREAIAFFEQALEAGAKLADTRENQSTKLDVLLKLGTALAMTKGGHAPEVEACFASAQELCETLADESRIFPATWGRWGAAFFSGRNREAGALAQRLLALGQTSNDSLRLLEGHHCCWATSMVAGSLADTSAHTDFGIEIYDPGTHHSAGILYAGHDPGVCARIISAWTLWDRGYADQARRRMQDAERLSRELGHQNTIAATDTFVVFLHDFLAESELAFEKSRKLDELVRARDLGQWIGIAAFLSGIQLVRRGHAGEGLDKALRALPSLRGWRYITGIPLLAEACGAAGEISRGIQLASDAIAIQMRDGLRFHLSECYRIRGQLRAKEAGGKSDAALADISEAINVAQTQQAKLLELRATASLARLAKSREERDEALKALNSCYRWFTEGFETRDLADARELMQVLA